MILSVDPGKVTGVACLMSGAKKPATAVYDRVAFEDWVANLLRSLRDERVTVVCENFVITAQTLRKSRQTDSLELIGLLRYLCRTYRHQLVIQDSADAKAFATDEALRRAGWWRASDHARDALRHLMLYVVRHRHVDARALNLVYSE